MKIKMECDNCGFIFKIPLKLSTLYKAVFNGDSVYLDSNCPRCSGQRFNVIDRNPYPRGKGLAFVIFEVKDGNKVNVRKIYLDGHIEGFEGNSLVVNHIFPKMQALKYFAQSINKEYRDLIRRFTLSDFYPMDTVDKLYKKFKETIEKI